MDADLVAIRIEKKSPAADWALEGLFQERYLALLEMGNRFVEILHLQSETGSVARRLHHLMGSQ